MKHNNLCLWVVSFTRQGNQFFFIIGILKSSSAIFIISKYNSTLVFHTPVQLLRALIAREAYQSRLIFLCSSSVDSLHVHQ